MAIFKHVAESVASDLEVLPVYDARTRYRHHAAVRERLGIEKIPLLTSANLWGDYPSAVHRHCDNV